MSQYIYGKNSVKAVIETHPERIYKIFIADSLKPDDRIARIYALAEKHKLQIRLVPRRKIEDLVGKTEEGQGVHQGVLASVAPKDLLSIADLIDHCRPKIEQGGHPVVLMLDGVTDPHNFGAILRIADAAGLDGVIIPKNNSAGFSPTVSKAASGAEETVNIVMVPNLVDAIKRLRDAGFWTVGAAGDEDAVLYTQQDYNMPTLLVMGSEGKGVSRLVKTYCDFKVKIPMHGYVDSLNVGTATAVLVFDIVNRPVMATAVSAE
ncbi:MAG: 23S rRNA (guanosine(2251)-2'-O)-methyltransferase RlmB [Vampirovibrio sp.]|nr:23S rRNA (guanosine(2251)-2'-O)-methyltransferase RlmB [Vampirovibrio sp.]